MSKSAELKKQIEYYLSDANLRRDDFFRDKIEASKDGWVEISHLLNCNKVKALGVKGAAEIAEAVKESEALEVSKDKKSVRRAKNLALPAKMELRKRDAKAQDKEEEKEKKEKKEKVEEIQDVEIDAKGNQVFVKQDFENPIIVHFETDQGDEEFKVNWKDVEQTIKSNFKKLKITYSRADQFKGEIAISSFKVSREQLASLQKSPLTIQGKPFKFVEMSGDSLKDFWQKQGGHYTFCTSVKLRNAKKNSKHKKQDERKEKSKKAKVSFEIAGTYYADINKVKSKSRAILNLKKNGEKLTGNDETFMKELVKFHHKHEEKMKDFDHFEVGEHPQYEKTRCFFVVRKNGEKEDISVSKSIQNLDQQEDNN